MIESVKSLMTAALMFESQRKVAHTALGWFLVNISIEMQSKGMVVSSHSWNNKTKLKALLVLVNQPQWGRCLPVGY